MVTKCELLQRCHLGLYETVHSRAQLTGTGSDLYQPHPPTLSSCERTRCAPYGFCGFVCCALSLAGLTRRPALSQRLVLSTDERSCSLMASLLTGTECRVKAWTKGAPYVLMPLEPSLPSRGDV
eukprot:scaffold13458_cov75-Phaeocystis_antarctica.AAC.4